MKLTKDELNAFRNGLTPTIVNQIEPEYQKIIRTWLEKKPGDSYTLYIDGAADLHSKRAGIGGIILRKDEELYTFSEFLPDATNNEAEYHALIKGLQLAMDLNCNEITVFSDSELIVKQINGLYKVKHPNMIPLYAQANNILKSFKSWSLSHIPREKNTRADKLSKDGMASGEEKQTNP